MKYSIFCTFIVLHTSLLAAQPQDEKQDPLLGNYTIGEAGEIFMIWMEDAISSTEIFQKIYDLNDDNLEAGTKHIQNGDFSRKTPMDVVTGDFNGDGCDDLVFAWSQPFFDIFTGGTDIELIIPEIESLEWTKVNKMTVDGGRGDGMIRLVAGYFDDDPEMEFALAFWAADGTIRLNVYDTDGSLMPITQDSTEVGFLDETLNEGARFDLAAGDFDGDRRDELILVAVEKESAGWNIYAQVYDYEDGALISKVKQNDIYNLDMAPDPEYSVNRLVVATGDFTANTLDEVVVGFQIFRIDDETLVYLQPLQISEDLNVINFDGTSLVKQIEVSDNHGWPMSIVTGDLNRDGRDEVLSAASTELVIYEADSTLEFIQIFKLGLNTQPAEDAHRTVALADLDGATLGPWLPEIVIAENIEVNPGIDPDSEFQIRVYEPNLDSLGVLTGFNLKGQLSDELTNSNAPRRLAMAVGDFNGDGVILRPPLRSRRTDIIQPIVVLNAPPVHFDVFDGVSYDVNRSFGPNEPLSFSKYEKEEQRFVEVKIEIHEDWATSTTLGGKFEVDLQIVSIEVEQFFRRRVGEGFSKSARASQTVTVGSEITAKVDDQIYATVVDYDIWEYPVFVEGDTSGYIVVVVPTLKENRWFPSKSRSGGSYVPNHEVGNILSYQEFTNPDDNEEIAFPIVNVLDAITSVVLDGNTDFTWSLQIADFMGSVDEWSNSFGRESAEPLFGGAGGAGQQTREYKLETLSTHYHERN